MTLNICNAKSLKVGSPSWSVIIQVIQRFPTRFKTASSFSNASMFRKFVLVDMQGTVINTIMFDNTIAEFDHLLHPYKRYKITNARIRPVDPDFKISDYNYAWTFTSKTPIELLDDVVPHPLQCPFDLVPFGELYKYADKDVSINVMGLVVQKLSTTANPSGGSIKKFTLLNQEKIPVILTIWINNELDCSAAIDENIALPISVLATNVHVSTYDGISLSSRKFTYLMINPPMKETTHLLEWFNTPENDHSLWQPQLMKKKPDRFFPFPSNSEILELHDAINNISKLRTAWVRGRLQYVHSDRGPCSVVCSNCNKALDADPCYMMTCMSCKQNVVTELSLRPSFRLSNTSTCILVSTISPVAESLLDINSSEMHTLYEQNSLPRKIEDSVENKLYICFIKVYYTKNRQETTARYSVLKFYPDCDKTIPSSSTTLPTPDNPISNPPTSSTTPPSSPMLISSTKLPSSQTHILSGPARKRLDFEPTSTDSGATSTPAATPATKKTKTD